MDKPAGRRLGDDRMRKKKAMAIEAPILPAELPVLEQT